MSSACDRKNSFEGMALQIILSTGRPSGIFLFFLVTPKLPIRRGDPPQKNLPDRLHGHPRG